MYRFQHQLQVDNISDPMLNNAWEVVMPPIDLTATALGGTDGHSVNYINGARNYTPIVEQIVFAPAGYKNSQDIRAITNYYNIPEDREDAKEATLTFFCDTSMLPQYYIQAWKRQMFDYENEFYYMPHQYKKDIVVVFFGAHDSIPTAKYTLKGCYPLMQSDFELSYTRTPKRMRITQKFNVDRVTIDANILQRGLVHGQLTSPLRNAANTYIGGGTTDKDALSGWIPDSELGGVKKYGVEVKVNK